MFPKKNRLSKRSDVLLVLRRGRKIVTSVCDIYLLRGGLGEEPRVAIVVSKKVSKSAVARNKVRRIFREILRTKVDTFSKDLRIVIVAKNQVLRVDKNFVESALMDAFKDV